MERRKFLKVFTISAIGFTGCISKPQDTARDNIPQGSSLSKETTENNETARDNIPQGSTSYEVKKEN